MNARPILVQALLILLMAFVVGAPASAQQAKKDTKATLLTEAAAAWDESDFFAAKDKYEEALKQGGLAPADVLTAYVRVGTAYAAMNQDAKAQSAFRVAAILEPTFTLPAEAGKKAAAIFKAAKKDAQHYGGKLEVTAEVPTGSAFNAPFVVVVRIDETFAALLSDVQVTVQDPSVSTSTVKPWAAKKPIESELQFDVPGKVVTAGANLLVRVDALDENGNRWASTQAHVQVERDSQADARLMDDSFNDDPRKKDKSGGFWSSPWPWVIGGAIVVGAGVGTFFATRSPSDARVHTPAWVPQ